MSPFCYQKVKHSGGKQSQHLRCRSTWLVQLTWLSEFEFTERQQKNSGKPNRMCVFLGFEPFLLSNSEAEWRDVVPAPQMQFHLARTWLSKFEFIQRQQKKISGKLIKLPVFLGFEPFLLSNSEAEWRELVSTPLVQVHKDVTIDVDVRI